MSIDAEVLIECWYSEQIPVNEWLDILKKRQDVRKMYNSRQRLTRGEC